MSSSNRQSSLSRRSLPMELLAEIFRSIPLPIKDQTTIEGWNESVRILMTAKCALKFAGPMFKKQMIPVLVRVIGEEIDTLICEDIRICLEIKDLKDVLIEGSHQDSISEEAKAKLKDQIWEWKEKAKQNWLQIQELSKWKKELAKDSEEEE